MKTMNWKNIRYYKPEPFVEVLVLVDGKRSANWSNNYTLVAYLDELGNWWQERNPSNEPIQGVFAWTHIEIPVNIFQEMENKNAMIVATEVVIMYKHEYDELVDKTYAENKPKKPYLYPSDN